MSTPVEPPRPALPPGRDPRAQRLLAGRYRLDRVIGRGAMGTVWAAYDEVLHRSVAIKEIDFPPGVPAHELEQLSDRTLREARAIAAMSNPHVITLFDILSTDSGPVIVMELLTARSLAQVLRQDGPLNDGQAATIGVAVAGGLLAAHAAGITHRDVKPGNVLIGHDGRVKLTDFGIARTSGETTLTAAGMLLGSPAYIAPEVASGQPAGIHADAWGLGALLFAAVQGRPPFDKGDPIATLTAVVTDPVPPHPRSGRLQPVIDGLLSKDPRGRLPVLQAYRMLQQIADDPTGMRLSGLLPVGPGAAGSLGSGPSPTGGPPSGISAPPISRVGPQPSVGSSPPPPPGWQPPTGIGQPGHPSGAYRIPPPPMPPPPWAGDGQQLRSLPPAGPAVPRRTGLRIVATLVAVVAAVGGYFGVRAVAEWSGAPPPATAPVATGH